MNEHRIESWSELQELLFADMWNDELGLFRSSHAYRGASNSRAQLGAGSCDSAATSSSSAS